MMSQTPKGILNRQTRIRVQVKGVTCVGNRQVAALQKTPNNLFGNLLHEGMVVKLANGGAGIIHKLIEPNTKLNGVPMSAHKGCVDDGDEGGDRSRKGRHPSWKEESKKEGLEGVEGPRGTNPEWKKKSFNFFIVFNKN